MNIILYLIFVFFIGSIFGYILELFYRRIVGGRWVNPGFLIGPYLPIYGFGLCFLSIIYYLFLDININPILVILLMGICMTVIELIGGIVFIKIGGVKLWDYSERKFNYKGIICLDFFIIWIFMSCIYYFFVADIIFESLIWFSNNIYFSFILGIFFGLIVLDFIYSTNILVIITNFAKNNNLIVKYEEFKKHIIDIHEKNKEKYSFLFPFKQKYKSLNEYLEMYKNKRK